MGIRKQARPGLNFKIPFVDQVQYVPVQRQLKQEFGYRTTSAGVNSTYRKAGYQGESLMLAGDLNLGDVEWVVNLELTILTTIYLKSGILMILFKIYLKLQCDK